MSFCNFTFFLKTGRTAILDQVQQSQISHSDYLIDLLLLLNLSQVDRQTKRPKQNFYDENFILFIKDLYL